MVIDAGKIMVVFEAGEKGWLDDLVVNLKYERICRAPLERLLLSPLTCGLVPRSAQGGWLRRRTLGVGGTDTQAKNPFHRLHQTNGNYQVMACRHFSVCVFVFIRE